MSARRESPPRPTPPRSMSALLPGRALNVVGIGVAVPGRERLSTASAELAATNRLPE